MNWLTDIPAAQTALTSYLVAHAQTLSAGAQAALVSAVSNPSPVDQIVNAGELLYALGDDGTTETRMLAAQLIEFAARNSWHNLGSDGRGAGIVAALRRDLGDEAPPSGWPAPVDDPAPRGEFVAAIEDLHLASSGN